MRPDLLYLSDLVAAAEAIERFLSDVEERQFLDDELLQSAVLQKLTIIGEAASRVSTSIRSEHPDIEWRTVVGLRNVVVHEYFALSRRSIWETASQDVPQLRRQVERLLRDLRDH